MSAIIFCETGMSCTRWGDEAHSNTLQASGVLQETSKNNSTPSRAPGEAMRTNRRQESGPGDTGTNDQRHASDSHDECHPCGSKLCCSARQIVNKCNSKRTVICQAPPCRTSALLCRNAQFCGHEFGHTTWQRTGNVKREQTSNTNAREEWQRSPELEELAPAILTLGLPNLCTPASCRTDKIRPDG
jgi:hypothetical protein